MNGFLIDLRQGWRSLRREPGFSACVILVLAAGVGAATAMFSIFDAALLKPLPYRAPERQVHVGSLDGEGHRAPMGSAEFLLLSRSATTVEDFAVYSARRATVTLPGGPTLIPVANVSASLFTTLDIAPARGRAFEPSEDRAGKAPVAIITDRFWRRELGADPAVLGRAIQVEHVQTTVVGILPPRATFPRLDKYDIFLPLAIKPEDAALISARQGLSGLARLKPGVTAAAARSEMDSLVHAFNGYHVEVAPLLGWLTGDSASALRAAFVAAILLLAIACANAALLLLMRGTARGRDLAIRAALGGGWRRVALQQISESLSLAVAGGAIGMGLAAVAVHAVVAFVPEGVPRLNEVRIDPRMAGFALGATLFIGTFAGVVSAWHAQRGELFEMLKSGGSGATPASTRSRLRDGLVVAQLAVALMLAAGTGLLLRSMARFTSVPVGVEPKDVYATFVYPEGPMPPAATDQLAAAARAVPGVEAAALVGYLPFEIGRGWDDSLTVEGRNPTETNPDYGSINWFTPGFLSTAGVRLLQGRELTAADRNAPVALINKTFVKRYLSGRDPIGASVGLYDWRPTRFVVVGVIDDIRQWGPASDPLAELYLPQEQFARNQEAYGEGAMLVVKSRLGLAALAASLRAAAAPWSGQLRLGSTRPVDDYLDWFFRQRRFQMDVALGFAAIALGLAAFGVYGSMAFSVIQRRREFAVRAALGAGKPQLYALVLGTGMRLVALGSALGFAGALIQARFLASLLFGVGERDPFTLVAVVFALALVALGATLLPASSAARADPMTILRDQ